MWGAPEKLALGLITGILFGFLLQKARVAKFEVIVGQFLFKNWTVVKVMGTAVIVGAIGVHGLISADLATLHIRPLLPGGILIGALCFGIGMAVLGYCPGTTVAACGEGRRDAMAGVLGMLVGALLFVVFNDALQPAIHSLGDSGKITFPEITGTSPWLWVTGLVAAGVAGWFFDALRNQQTWRRPRAERPASAGSPR